MTGSSQPSDLVQRARAADPQAISTIYESHAGGIFRYIYYRVRDVELARDIQSEVFVKMLEGLPDYEDRGWSISAWLYRIARDRTIDSLRRRQRHNHQPIEEWSAVCAGPDEGLDSFSDSVVVRQAMERLSAGQRQVLTLRCIYDLSLEETARQMGRSVGSVKSLQFRAMQSLSQLLRGAGEGDGLARPPTA